MIFRMKLTLLKTREVLRQEVHEDLTVMEAFDNFMTDLLQMRQKGQALSEEEVHRILNATEFAAGRHQNQARRNKEHTPYIVHPLHVAHHLLMTGHIYDADILMAALLHDTIEDTETTLDELRSHFGYKVQHLVDELTDDKQLKKEERKRIQIQKASDISLEAALIMLADKLSNLSDILESPPIGWDEERTTHYFLWAQEVIKNLPPVNPFLLDAVETVIEAYWKRLAKQEYGE
jgi:(p)ppGpp synthase/HD superfamily hydrolase